MLLSLDTFIFLENATLGFLSIDGEFECFTLELPWLDNKPYVSCIPEGTYKVELEYSGRFGKELPELRDVPGRSEIKFHPANFPSELKGCIAPGQLIGRDFVRNSGLAMNSLLYRFKTMSVEEEAWITINRKGGRK